MTKLRTFIAVPLPENIKTEIAAMTENFIHEFSSTINLTSIRWVNRENLHLTLIFLGEVTVDFVDESQKIVEQVAKTYKSFNIQLKGLGVFPNMHSARVLWIGIKDDANNIIKIQKLLVDSLMAIGYKPEERKFHPHVTIARFKIIHTNEIKDKLSKILKINYESTIFPIDSLILFKSTLTPDGPIYEVIKKFKLV
ncbi:MAG: RNA 2',3'-cyclic phosphodiesterase [candidate division WOR-3 bacterium]|nr:RNA 2',3'-cyclic phosphodiesterase [candidate division WOR-3 bacterium]